MKQKTIFVVATVLLLAMFLVGTFLYKNQQSEQATQLAAQNQVALVRAHAPSFGNPNAPVHIVEFLDPACGTCRDFYPLVKKLIADHPGQIRVSVRYAPFHPGSDQVVKLIEAARKQAQFRQTLETLFASQSAWVQNHTANIDLVWPQLKGLGLDMDRLQNDMNDPEIAQRIAQDLADAKTMKVTMTPEFFVNGKPLPSFGFDELKTLVDEALVKANQRQGSP
jgi:protein-disulfide isomerase